MARTQDAELLHTLQKGFKYIENESFASTFQGLFSEINLDSEKLGKRYAVFISRSHNGKQVDAGVLCTLFDCYRSGPCD